MAGRQGRSPNGSVKQKREPSDFARVGQIAIFKLELSNPPRILRETLSQINPSTVERRSL